MLNLSDKELDRLSREAAQEHDPGDVLGSRSWEKLEPRLDTDLGKGLNPLRGVRRFPFYYVPAILIVAGIFYFVKQGKRSQQAEPSGSPPSAATQSVPATPAKTDSATVTLPLSSTQNPDHRINSTPSVTPPAPANAASTPNATAATGAPAPDHARTTPPAVAGTAAATRTGTATTTSAATTTGATTNTRTTALNTHSNRRNHTGKNNSLPGAHTKPATAAPSPADVAARGSRTNTGKPATAGPTTGSAAGTPANPAARNSRPHELTLSSVHGPRSLRQHPFINDSALRAYKTPTSPIQLAKSKSLHIDRSLQFGLSIAPDFSSVNSMAGDKPGSSIGITVDYQFANRWYLSTGLFLDRKNYAARPQDYHVSYDYYRMNGMHNVNLVKGTFSMLEIPLNLRYDFSVTGNTLFFASAGASSYLFANENCNYYMDMFGREYGKSYNYPGKNYLFASVNLSLGVETGLSNNLSLLVAPYVKLPSRNIGFGQVSVSSVGINFALKFAPVISRQRR
jgi:hypothetical protein